MFDRQRIRMDEFNRAVLEDLDLCADYLASIKYLLSLSTGNIRVATQLALRFVLVKPAFFFQPAPGEAIAINDIQALAVTVYGKDVAGNTTPLDPAIVPAWSVADPSILNLTVSFDGTSATLESTGKIGTTTVLVQAGTLTPAQTTIKVGYSAPAKVGVKFDVPK